MTLRPSSVCRCINIQIEGAEKPKWGSFAKIGFPLAVCVPEMTQLFDASVQEARPAPCLKRRHALRSVVRALRLPEGEGREGEEEEGEGVESEDEAGEESE